MHEYYLKIKKQEKIAKALIKQINQYLQTISEAEKKFEQNIKRYEDLNKLLYEYETLSMETY